MQLRHVLPAQGLEASVGNRMPGVRDPVSEFGAEANRALKCLDSANALMQLRHVLPAQGLEASVENRKPRIPSL